MARISSLNRGDGAGRRLPISEMKELFKDGRVWCQLGKVYAPDSGKHWYIDTDENGQRSVMVEVETIPEGLDLTCKLATRPLWWIPPVGTVVYISIPSGEIDHCPAIVGIDDTGASDDDISEEVALLAAEGPFALKSTDLRLGGVDADQPLVKGTAAVTARDSFLDALMIYANAIQSIADPLGVATGALGTAIAAYKAKSILSGIARTK